MLKHSNPAALSDPSIWNSKLHLPPSALPDGTSSCHSLAHLLTASVPVHKTPPQAECGDHAGARAVPPNMMCAGDRQGCVGKAVAPSRQMRYEFVGYDAMLAPPEPYTRTQYGSSHLIQQAVRAPACAPALGHFCAMLDLKRLIASQSQVWVWLDQTAVKWLRACSEWWAGQRVRGSHVFALLPGQRPEQTQTELL